MGILVLNAIKVFSLGIISFVLAIFLTPFLTHFLYKYKLWKKKPREKTIDGQESVIFKQFHSEKETNVPRFGGVLVWIIPLLMTFIFFLLSKTNIYLFQKLNFLSRDQTWLPLFSLVSGAILGLIDDILQVKEKGKYIGGGLSLKYRLIIVFLIGLVGGLWFYFKLNRETIYFPGIGNLEINFWIIPLFILVTLATYSGGVIDGLDGLSGGVFGSIFGGYLVLAFVRQQFNLAAFCAVILGSLLGFLWFNIPPARFYMGETGILGLCTSLTVVAFLTDSVMVLPIIGFLLVIESGSVILQLVAKKFFKRKLFLAAPIHHYFEAKGWPHYKITMRFWVISTMMTILGVVIRLLG